MTEGTKSRTTSIRFDPETMDKVGELARTLEQRQPLNGRVARAEAIRAAVRYTHQKIVVEGRGK